jgi:hypothetical protein
MIDMNKYDVIIIGAGVSGCAVARELARYRLRVCVLDRNSDIGEGTSKANSGIVHAGYDAKPGTLKARLNVQGSVMMPNLAKSLGIPFMRNGSLVVALTDEDVSHMTLLRDRIIDSVLEIDGSALNGPRHDRLCNNTHFRFEGVKGTELVIKLSSKGIAASTASACSASDNEPSHVLSAIGLNSDQALSSLRLTLSGLNTDEDVDRLLSVLPETIKECRSH